MALLIVSHDLGVIAGTADRVAVMYAGRIVGGIGRRLVRPPAASLHRRPHRLGAAAGRTPPLTPIPGAVPAPGRLGSGCAFAERCQRSQDRCRRVVPPLAAWRRATAASRAIVPLKRSDLQPAARHPWSRRGRSESPPRDPSATGRSWRSPTSIWRSRPGRGESAWSARSGSGQIDARADPTAGLEAPSDGHVLFEGAPLVSRDCAAFRRQCGRISMSSGIRCRRSIPA